MRKHGRIRRKYYSARLIHELIGLYKEYPDKKLNLIETPPAEIYLSEYDRITHLAYIDESRKILEVINISYEILLEDKWVTIVRFDSHHGYLHRHTRISLENETEVDDSIGVKKKGKPHLWYTWSIQDIKKRFIEYRARFTRRSRISNLGY